jgi:ankyrin repeat protein
MFYSQGKVCSALLTAAYRGHKDIIEMLIASGASIHAVDNLGETSLHKSSSQGHLNVVELLIACEAQIDARSAEGCTPLYLAAWDRHKEVSQLLLNYGAKMEPDIAVMLGDVELVKHYLDSGLNANSKLARGSTKGESWLITAIGGKNINLVKLLLNHGANINEKTEFANVSPLHRSSAIGSRDICQLLITYGADVNAEAKYGQTPLHLATQYGHQDIVELLLDCGANINALDLAGCSPIFNAAQSHHQQIVECFLSRGARVNLTDREDFTPLLRAFQRAGGDETIRVLVAYGADVNVRGGRENLSPLHLAVAQNNKNIVELLLAHGAREGLE